MDKINTGYLNMMKMSEENKENMVKMISAWYAAIHLSGGCQHRTITTPTQTLVGPLTNSVDKFGRGRLEMVCCEVEVFPLGLNAVRVIRVFRLTSSSNISRWS